MKLKDSNIYPLDKINMMWHLATIIDGNHEYIIMTCLRGSKKGKIYIEELVKTSIDYTNDTFGNFKFINDQNLVQEIVEFANTKDLLDVAKRFEQMVNQELIRDFIFSNSN